MSIKNIGAIIKKELFSLLISPAVYIAIIIFMVSSGVAFFFGQHFFIAGVGSTDLRLFYSFFPYIAIITIPILTMGGWAQEVKDIVFALPVSTYELVLGKCISTLILTTFMQLVLLLIPLTVNNFGYVDFGQVFTANFVIFLYFACVCSLGLLISLISNNQITSAIITMGILAIINAIHLIPLYITLPAFVLNVANFISFSWHFDSASKGILDSRDVIFYCVLTALFLFLTGFIAEKRKIKR